MSQTKAGATKARNKIKELHGEDFFKKIGKIGGSVTGITKGFAIAKSYPLDDPRHPSNAGRKGGEASRRGKAIKTTENAQGNN